MLLKLRSYNKLLFTTLIFSFPILTPTLAQAQDLGVGTPGNIAELVQAYYKYAIGAVGIVATAVLVFGGLLYVMAAGNPSRVENAKAWITSALTGFVLALFAYTLLYFINPNLVSFRPIYVESPPESDSASSQQGCCRYDDPGGIRYITTDRSSCDALSGSFDPNTFANSTNSSCVPQVGEIAPGCCEHRVITDTGTEPRCENVSNEEMCVLWQIGEGDDYNDSRQPAFYPGGNCRQGPTVRATCN